MSEHIEITPEIIEIRHYLHAHPERSFKEYETSAYIEKLLRAHDIEVLNNPLETGVVGLIRGEQPGPRIALRADIDGLPIQEDTGLPFSSVNDGVMHGCGHDLHMSYMLGAAFWLAKRRKRIKGSIKLLFQPAEELGLGAKAMSAMPAWMCPCASFPGMPMKKSAGRTSRPGGNRPAGRSPRTSCRATTFSSKRTRTPS